jgi:hypothetical protein
LERCVDFPELSETSAPEGFVRAYAEDGAPRWVNDEGRVFRVDLEPVPLGGILPYWPPVAVTPGADAPPENFEWCDGTAVTTPGSPFFGYFKPELMATTDAPGANAGMMRGYSQPTGAHGGRFPHVEGGDDTHTHDGTATVSGVHDHEMSNHEHFIFVEPDHNHGGVTSGANSSNVGKDFADDAPLADFDEHTHTISQDGAHDHGGMTSDMVSNPRTQFDGAHDHPVINSTESSLPRYIEVAYIVRVL